MVVKSVELPAYYQRETILPKFLTENWNNISHVAELALPLIGLLYKPAGKAISLGVTSLHAYSTGAELRTAKTWTNAWSLVKNGAEFVGTIASLRIGLAVHSAMNLGENLYALREYNKLTWSQTGEKMLPVASNALYLLTLVSFSNPVSFGIIGASLVFQAGWSLYKARHAYKDAKTGWKDIKMLDVAAHTAMSMIFAWKGKTALEQSYKIYTAVPRTFVLMRPASKHNKETDSISEKGKILAETKMPVALRQIANEKGKKTLFFYTSFAGHHVDTAMIVANKFDEDQVWVTRRQDLNETKKPEISMHDPIGGYFPPQHALVKTKTRTLKERWELLEKRLIESHQEGIEGPAQVAARMDGAIRQILSKHPVGPSLPVIVTGGTNMTRFIEGEILKTPNIPEQAARSIKDGGMRVVTMTPDDMGDLHVSEVTAVDPKQVEMPVGVLKCPTGILR